MTNVDRFYLTCTLAAAAILAAAPAGRPASGGPPKAPDDKAAIADLLSAYEAALNASSTDAVMPLYAEDGVFMPPFSQSAVGTEAIRQAYDAVFKAITLSVKFRVVEVVEMAPDWAFARTSSAGTVTVNASGGEGRRGEPGAVHLQEGEGRHLEDRALQFFPHQPAAADVRRGRPSRLEHQ